MGIARCKRGVRMMREIERLKKGAVGMKTKKMRSFSECASPDEFFAQYVCGGGGTNLSSPSPNPNTVTSSPPPPPRQQNQAKDHSSPTPITAAVAAGKTPPTTTSPPRLHPNPTEEKSVLSVPHTPPISPITAADDSFAQFLIVRGSKGNPDSKPPSPPPTTAAAASNSSPPPPQPQPQPQPQQSQIANNHQIAAAHESKSKSMDGFLAEFDYDGKGKGKGGGDWANHLSSPIPKPPPLNAAASAAAATASGYPTAPPSPPSSSVQQWQPYPMPYVVLVDGEIRVMSRFFPPPPNAIIIHVEEEEVEEVVVEVEVLMVPASNPTRKRKNTAEEMLELDGDAENPRKKMRIKQRSVLTAAEKRKDCYRRVVNGSSAWVPPASPYKLLQEQHFSDPWRVVIICMLLNLTTGTQVRKVLDDLFLLCPNAEAATMVCEEELELLLKSLGLWRIRAVAIKRLSRQFLCSDWTHVTQLHGVGKYAADAYAIFCAGKPWEVVPQDHKLVDYWRFVLEKLVHAL